jgi:hypothetical protein
MNKIFLVPTRTFNTDTCSIFIQAFCQLFKNNMRKGGIALSPTLQEGPGKIYWFLAERPMCGCRLNVFASVPIVQNALSSFVNVYYKT